MRLIRGLIMGVGIIGILVVIALITGLYLYTLSPSILGRAAPVAVTADAAQSFDTKLESTNTQIKAAVEAREKRDVNLTITESEANSKLVQMLAEGELPLKKILLNFGNGYFLAYAVVDTPVIDARTGTIGRIEKRSTAASQYAGEFTAGRLAYRYNRCSNPGPTAYYYRNHRNRRVKRRLIALMYPLNF
jgi:hypothetical protein